MSEVEKVNYISVGKTVGIYVEINGERQLFVDKQVLLAKLREEVENLVEYTETEAYKRAGFYYDRDDVDALLEKAGGE